MRDTDQKQWGFGLVSKRLFSADRRLVRPSFDGSLANGTVFATICGLFLPAFDWLDL
jgi:hypothetical protein